MKEILNTVCLLFKNVFGSWSIIWRLNKKYYFYKVIKIIIGIIFSVAAVYFPAAIVENVYPQFRMDYLIGLVAIWLALQLLSAIIGRAVENRLSIISMDITSSIKASYLSSLSDLRLDEIESSDKLDNIEFAKGGISQGCEMKIIDSFLSLIQALISIFLIVGMLSKLSVVFFLLLLLVTVVQTVANSKLEKKKFEYDEKNTNIRRRLNYSIWGLTGVEFAKEMRLFGLRDYTRKRFNTDRKTMYKNLTGQSKIMAKFNIIPSVLYGIVYLLVYGMAAYSVHSGSLTVGDFVLFTGGVLSFNGYISSISGCLVVLVTQSRYIESYKKMFKGSTDCCQKVHIDFSDINIEFRNVWYRYPNQNEYALQDVSLTIPYKTHIAVVGQNGSGKTTFIKLMMGFYRPTKGEILINGVNIENVDTDDLRSVFAPVFQDYYITAYSVKDNIAFSADDRENDEEKILNAVEQSGFINAVEKMPGGIDCSVSRQIDENGVDVSGGESQKLAIARAVYKNSPVLVLDEPTAALSPNAEYELYKRFHEICDKKTALFISHRLGSCRLCDRVVVFEGGSIIENGSHEQLMKENGIYAHMFKTQAEYYSNVNM